MAEIKKDYYPYPGYDNYYQVTTNPFNNIPKMARKTTYSKKEVDAMIEDVIAKINASAKGVSTDTVEFANLPDPSETILSVIYNITDQFTSDERFLDGAGKTYPAGTNVICVMNNNVYKYDVVMGEISKISDEGIDDIINNLYND